MIPLIRWLNSFNSTTTFFCCQGEPPEIDPKTQEEYTDDCHRPYVMFICFDTVDLVKILDTFGNYGTTEINWSRYKSQIEYVTRFHDQKCLKEVIDKIEIIAQLSAEASQSPS
jgi:hypothetical protein